MITSKKITIQERKIVYNILSLQESKETLLESLVLDEEDRQFVENAGAMEAEFIERLLYLTAEEAEQEIANASATSHALDDLKRNYEKYLAQAKGKSTLQVLSMLKNFITRKAFDATKKGAEIGKMDVKDVPGSSWNWAKSQFNNTYHSLEKEIGPTNAAIATTIWLLIYATTPGGMIIAPFFKWLYPIVVKGLTR